MNPLEQKIADRIRAEGPLNFETFMEMALYYPGLGYYTREAARIGRAGDFYTSPHLHSLFGAMLGRQLEEMWQLMGRPDTLHAVEMGAGMGYLAKDLLDYLKHKELYPCLAYTIIELNPSMRRNQEELLREHTGKVSWASALRDLSSMRGCIVSNELLDAFPVRLVEMDDELSEVYVSVSEEGHFIEVKKPCSPEIADYFAGFSIALPKGFKTEVNLRIREWLQDISRCLEEGFVLTIDYGYSAGDYYSEDRSRGTLLCYHQHQLNENPYQHIGEQDMTAHVNFSSLKKWGEQYGLKAVGLCSQGPYLVALGIDEVITERYGPAPDPFEMARVKKLLFPQGMGESHKVMIQYKGKADPHLRGFSFRNQAGKL
ncbi:MAG: SAM-dependent methyltransferase [Nitrospirota bacterium]